MTGHQQHPATGKNLKGEPAPVVLLDELCKACGVKDLQIVDAYDVKAVEKAAKMMNDDKVSVGIYPEGTRNKTYVGLLPFHNSVFKIAHKANNAPIVIVGVSGTEKIHKNTPWKRTHVYLEVMRTISTEEVQSMRTNELGKITEENLLKFLEEHGHVRVEIENPMENNAENTPIEEVISAENSDTVSA
jgi:1-acyl-sn-glycerol-3-phosphate acyltransferase